MSFLKITEYDGVTKPAVRTKVAGIRSHVTYSAGPSTHSGSFPSAYLCWCPSQNHNKNTIHGAVKSKTTTIIIFQN